MYGRVPKNGPASEMQPIQGFRREWWAKQKTGWSGTAQGVWKEGEGWKESLDTRIRSHKKNPPPSHFTNAQTAVRARSAAHSVG